jgi:hypothetical protein
MYEKCPKSVKDYFPREDARLAIVRVISTWTIKRQCNKHSELKMGATVFKSSESQILG